MSEATPAKGGWLSRGIGYLRAVIPVVIKFIPALAGWASVIYVAIDFVIWVLKHWGL